MISNRKNKVTLIIFVIVAVAILVCGFYGLKDAQALDENVTFVSNFVENLTSDVGICVSAGVVALAVLSIIVPRLSR